MTKSSVTCPACGMEVSADARHCPLCQARVHPITLRRMALWALIAVAVLIGLVFWVARFGGRH